MTGGGTPLDLGIKGEGVRPTIDATEAAARNTRSLPLLRLSRSI